MEKFALKQVLFIPLAAALLAGCTVLPSVHSLSPAVIAQDRGVLQLQPRLLSGYAALSSVSPIIPANVDHLTVALFTVDGNSIEHVVLDNSGNPVTKDISQANLANPITFNSLKLNTRYRVKAIAYNAAAQVISAPCSLDVVVGVDEQPTIQPLNITLMDTVFSGTGTTSISFTEGSLSYAGIATVSLSPHPLVLTLSINATAPHGVAVNICENSFYYGDVFYSTGSTLQHLESGATSSIEVWNLSSYPSTVYGVSRSVDCGVIAGFNGVKNGYGAQNFYATHDGVFSPYYAAVLNSGVLYGSIPSQNKIIKINDTNDAEVLVLGGLNNPKGMVADSLGNLYVANAGNNEIIKYTIATGATASVGTGFSNPCGVDADPFGNVYVADTGNNCVKKVSPTGTIRTIVTGLNAPEGVGVDDKNGIVYVADTGNNCIKAFR